MYYSRREKPLLCGGAHTVYHRSSVEARPRCVSLFRYYSLLDEGKKKVAYGYVAQLFDGMDLAEVARLCEECFEANVENLVRTCESRNRTQHVIIFSSTRDVTFSSTGSYVMFSFAVRGL